MVIASSPLRETQELGFTLINTCIYIKLKILIVYKYPAKHETLNKFTDDILWIDEANMEAVMIKGEGIPKM